MSDSTIQVSVKVSPRVIERAEGLRDFLSEEHGRDVSRAEVFRRALAIGLRELARKRHATTAPSDDDE